LLKNKKSFLISLHVIDYIIVGCGLGGIAFAETAIRNSKSVIVFENGSQNASSVAAGIYNPVILKRFSTFPYVQEQLNYASTFYKELESKLHINFYHDLPVYRKFFSVEEQNNWFSASDKPNLTPFLSTEIKKINSKSIVAPYGFGEVLQTGYANTQELINSYRNFLTNNNWLSLDSFDYKELKPESEYITYKNYQAKNIVFSEGFGMHFNPFFNYLPLDGTKGELLLIGALNLDLNIIVNSSLYIVPVGNDMYKVGATYNWDDKTQNPTQIGKEELINQLKQIINCDFEVIQHLAGVRPTVRDRKPLLGSHKEHKNMFVFNGLGTRGVMQAPYLAGKLYDYIEKAITLDKEYDIKRFDKSL
jgi:glycine oxidase